MIILIFDIISKMSLLIYSIQNYLNKELTNFFRLNIISLRLNTQYKLNKYLTILLILGIISSIIIRTNLISEDLLYINNEFVNLN